jgi:hypothetical protein
MTKRIMPAFVFERRHDIELEAGFTLAGHLIVDLPRNLKKLTENEQQMLAGIVRQLTDDAQSGRLPADAVVYGWHGDRGRPPDAVDTSNDEVMAAWARKCLRIGVRVDPRNDGQLRIDSDIVRQLDPKRGRRQ